MKIILDGDACPGAARQLAFRLAAARGRKVVHVASFAHWSARIEAQETLWVDKAAQESDMVIANMVEAGDIVVTADHGLAALVLARGGRAISPRGYLYSKDNWERLLLDSFLQAKVRRGGGRTRGPRAYSLEDERRFAENLSKLLDSVPCYPVF